MERNLAITARAILLTLRARIALITRCPSHPRKQHCLDSLVLSHLVIAPASRPTAIGGREPVSPALLLSQSRPAPSTRCGSWNGIAAIQAAGARTLRSNKLR